MRVISSLGRINDKFLDWLFQYRLLVRMTNIYICTRMYIPLYDIYYYFSKRSATISRPNLLSPLGSAARCGHMSAFSAVGCEWKRYVLFPGLNIRNLHVWSICHILSPSGLRQTQWPWKFSLEDVRDTWGKEPESLTHWLEKSYWQIRNIYWKFKCVQINFYPVESL